MVLATHQIALPVPLFLPLEMRVVCLDVHVVLAPVRADRRLIASKPMQFFSSTSSRRGESSIASPTSLLRPSSSDSWCLSSLPPTLRVFKMPTNVGSLWR